MEERIAISKQDLYRLDVLTNVQKKSLKQFQTAQLLELSNTPGAASTTAFGRIWAKGTHF